MNSEFLIFLKNFIAQWGIIISLFFNIVWIARSFLRVNEWSKGNNLEDNLDFLYLMGQKYKKEKHSYSLLFFNKIVEFLFILFIETFWCGYVDATTIPTSLAGHIPLLTVFIVSSCFISGQNERLLQELKLQREKDYITGEIINKLCYQSECRYPILLIDKEIGLFSFIKLSSIDDFDIILNCVHIIKNGKTQVKLQPHVPRTYNVGNSDEYIVPLAELANWKVLEQDAYIVLKLEYYYSTLNKDREGRLDLCVKLNAQDNLLIK